MLRNPRFEINPPPAKISSTGRIHRSQAVIGILIQRPPRAQAKLAEAYGLRWTIETCLKHLKTTMKMDVLRCLIEAAGRNGLSKTQLTRATKSMTTVSVNQIYMIKTKSSMKKRAKSERKSSAASQSGKLSSATLWVDAIKLAKQLLTATGSVDNAIALLHAIEN